MADLEEKVTVVRIYIDSTGISNERAFAEKLQYEISLFQKDFNVELSSFGDISDAVRNQSDKSSKEMSLKAIENADIVFPIVTTSYLSHVSSYTASLFNDLIAAKNRFLFPIVLGESDWSSHDWVVKTHATLVDVDELKNYQAILPSKAVNQLLSRVKVLIASQLTEQNLSKEFPISDTEDKAVFISHDHDDSDFSELLKLRLEKEGIASWIDTEKLKIGQDWREEIDQGIESSLAVLAVMTPEARKSEYVTYEWAFAWGKGKKIFPVMLKQTQLHPRLESLQYLNFTDKSSRPWDKLIESIKQL